MPEASVWSATQHKPAFDSLAIVDPLTQRETEVLRMIAAGYSNREIAGALGCAEGTVKNHASSVLSKLGVRESHPCGPERHGNRAVMTIPRRSAGQL